MQRLRTCIDALRFLAKQPDTGNRLLVAELRVEEYLRPDDAAAVRSSLESLDQAVRIEAERRPSQRSFWDGVLDLIASRISKLSDNFEPLDGD